jgi:hypothetical protein
MMSRLVTAAEEDFLARVDDDVKKFVGSTDDADTER